MDNVRFNELAEQVGLGVKHGGIVLTKNVNAAEALEKFAELIVFECSKVCKDYSAQILTFSQFGSNGAADCAKLIREHFGFGSK